MAVFGLASPTNKGKYSLQSAAQSLLSGLPVNEETLPTNAFQARPLPTQPYVAGEQPIPIVPAKAYSFKGKYDAINRGLQAEESDAGLARRTGLQSVAETFQRSQQEAARQQEKARKSLLAKLADMGALTSGGALVKEAELSENYNRYLDDLARAKAQDQANVERNYAGVLNTAARRREALFAEQQAEEETRRIEDARLRAEAERSAAEAAQRKQEMARLIEAQEAARIAAEQAAQQAAAARVSYSPGGVGGGGGGYSSSYQEPEPAPAPVQTNVVLPPSFAARNVPSSVIDAWVKREVDPTLSGAELRKISAMLVKAGKTGLDRGTLGQAISGLRGNSANPSFFY